MRAPRVAVRYNLLALRAKTVHITSGQIEGLYVHARTLRDGRLNLAALVKPKEKPSGPLPVGFRVEDVYVVGSARYDLAPVKADEAAPPFQRVEVGLRLAVGAKVPLGAGPIEAQIKGLEVAVQAPLPATLTLRGGAKIQGSAVSVDKLELGLKAVLPDVGRLLPAFGEEGARWLPGEVRLDLSADGTLQAMNLKLALHLPPAGAEAGQLSFQGTVGPLDAALPWRFEPLAFTRTQRALLVPDRGERYPAAARVRHTGTGGEFLLVGRALAESPVGSAVLQRLGLRDD